MWNKKTTAIKSGYSLNVGKLLFDILFHGQKLKWLWSHTKHDCDAVNPNEPEINGMSSEALKMQNWWLAVRNTLSRLEEVQLSKNSFYKVLNFQYARCHMDISLALVNEGSINLSLCFSSFHKRAEGRRRYSPLRHTKYKDNNFKSQAAALLKITLMVVI